MFGLPVSGDVDSRARVTNRFPPVKVPHQSKIFPDFHLSPGGTIADRPHAVKEISGCSTEKGDKGMKLRKPWMIKMAAWLGAGALRVWRSTIRCQTDSQGQQTDPWDSGLKERFIYSMWHDSMLLLPCIPTGFRGAALISQSKDGELLARMGQYFGMLSVRGSSSRGGMDAMEEVIRLKEHAHMVVAPDGPRGPRHEVKRGLVALASWTGLRVVPIGVGFSRAWRAKSWDRMSIPKPFSSIYCVAGPIIQVPQGVGKGSMEQYRRLIEQTMLAATEAAEALAAGKKITVEWPSLTAAAA
jgi:lysophospholipid acyltransferase (LPLAT)-like uncharacterized protein